MHRRVGRQDISRLGQCEQTFAAKCVPLGYDTQVYWAVAGIMGLLIFLLSIIDFIYASGY